MRMNTPANKKLCVYVRLYLSVCSFFFSSCATNSSSFFSLRPVACKRKGKLTVARLHGGGIRVVCVFADHCKTGPLWRRLPDCHSAGFSSLNKVGVSNGTCVDQEIPLHPIGLGKNTHSNFVKIRSHSNLQIFSIKTAQNDPEFTYT